MLRRTALTALLLLSADAATTALAPLGAPSLTAEAAAADFTGRIKRVKIKKRRTGSSYRMVVQTSGGTSGSVDKVEAYVHPSSFEPRDEDLEVIVLDIDVQNRLVATSDSDGGIFQNGVLIVFLSNIEDDDFGWEDGGGEYSPEERTSLEVVMENGQGEGATESGQKVRVRVTNDGALRVIVSNEDRDWDPDAVASIGYSLDGETVSPVEIEEVRQKWIVDLETDLSEYEAATVETILYDADGVVLDSQTQTVSLSEEDDPGFDQVSVKETKKGITKLVTWTTSGGDVSSLEVELTDSETGEAALYTVDDAPVLTERTYLYEDIGFDPGESPEDYIYLCLIDLIDANGDPVGEQHEVELTIPTLTEGEDFAISPASFADGTGSVSVLNTGDGYHVVGALWHEDAGQAESFNLIFEEPYEGPAPLETEVNATIVSQKDKWIQKGDDALPSSYDLTTTLTTAEGVVLESVFASGSGTGTVYKEGGGIVAGTVVTIGDKEVILNIGFKSEGN